MERLVKGRERIFLDRFWNEFSADPKNFDEASRVHYAALYARPHVMHDGFEQFHAFDQDVIDNHEFLTHGPLTMPVLAIGGEKVLRPDDGRGGQGGVHECAGGDHRPRRAMGDGGESHRYGGGGGGVSAIMALRPLSS